MSDYKGLRRAAEAATPGPWVVFDMDEAEKRKDEPMNEPGEGWYWVWAENRLPYYGGVFEPEKHHPDCGAAIGEAKIVDGVGGKQEQADATYIAAASPDVVLGLLDEVEALRAKLARVEVLATAWADAAGEPATSADLTALTIANRHGRMLRDALDDTDGAQVGANDNRGAEG